MDSRRPRVSARAVVRDAWERFDRRQTPFSYMSAAVPLLLATVFVFDLLLPHPHLNRSAVSLWLTFYIVATVLPLVLGRRYPLWAGLVMFAGIESLSTYFLLASIHVHAEINALLELPLIALYIGWFSPALLGRALIGLGVVRLLFILHLNPDLGNGVSDPRMMVGYAILVALFCFEGARTVQRQLRKEARLDSLTGALNRRGLQQLAGVVRRRAARSGEPVTVAMLDFDDFKGVNDAGGHLAGDTALSASVDAWNELVGRRGTTARRGGLVARLGGDEFALVFRGDAAAVEEQLGRLRTDSDFSWSWGIATARAGEPLDAVLARADAELYRAKPGGGRGTPITR
ncbi:GGDEF domain-containing protein [Leucobacter sp. Marseille-Q4368]|uniref:GGDEF domain-containing protein n=1 Tax=Leucobacter manosquensis TaxID=2810611 RepID=A0ABS5M8U8_9MICO|nr:GGDEF domain-containing protein [Leucobacter manosquensis]